MRVSWFSIALGLLLAGIVHIVAVLSWPRLLPQRAWDRLATFGNVNTLTTLPAASPAHQTFSYMAPNVRYAICRYDLTEGPSA